MKLATWNVNSLRVRLPHLQEWLAATAPDVVCLQETKTEDEKFCASDLERAGYRSCYSGQKAYNGVAIVSREPAIDVQIGIPGYDDPQRRVIAATFDQVRVVCVYVPNGESVDSPKFQYKLDWLQRLTAWVETQLRVHPQLVLLGDFNIAPEDDDVYDPQAWAGQVLCSDPERQAFRRLIGLGLVDSFRMFAQPPRSYTWWDYRMNMFKRNLGLRIDHILLSNALAPRCTTCVVHRDMRAKERPSDHAPLTVELMS